MSKYLRQTRENVLLRNPGESEDAQCQRDQPASEPVRHERQLHNVHDPLRRSEEHVSRNEEINNDSDEVWRY